MKHWISRYLTKKQIHEISDCVRRAEVNTSAELVPIIVRSSTKTAYVPWMMTMTWVLFFIFVISETEWNQFLWDTSQIWIWIPLLAAFIALSFFSLQFHSMIRMFLFKNDMVHSILDRAELEFSRQKIDSTKDQMGVLLFISVLERKALIYADEKISAKIKNEDWEIIIKDLMYKLKNNEWNEGLIKAIDQIGKKLELHFPHDKSKGENQNELSNELIILD